MCSANILKQFKFFNFSKYARLCLVHRALHGAACGAVMSAAAEVFAEGGAAYLSVRAERYFYLVFFFVDINAEDRALCDARKGRDAVYIVCGCAVALFHFTRELYNRNLAAEIQPEA